MGRLNAKTQNAVMENAAPDGKNGKRNSGKQETKFAKWKTQDLRLWNSKCVIISSMLDREMQ